MRLMVLFCFLIAACSNKKSTGILSVEEMKPVLFDVIRADEFANSTLANDTTKNLQYERVKLYEKVFALHKVNKDVFYNSYKFYQKHPDLHKQLFDSLTAYGDRVREIQDSLPPMPKRKAN